MLRSGRHRLVLIRRKACFAIPMNEASLTLIGNFCDLPGYPGYPGSHSTSEFVISPFAKRLPKTQPRLENLTAHHTISWLYGSVTLRMLEVATSREPLTTYGALVHETSIPVADIAPQVSVDFTRWVALHLHNGLLTTPDWVSNTSLLPLGADGR